MEYIQNIRPGGAVIKAASVYPMPFNKDKNTMLCFPIADDITIGNEKVLLTIYDVNQTMLYSQQVEATTDNTHRVIKYNPHHLEVGVYTFTISRGDIDLIGKFVVK
jgi:hypothetical protein